MSDRLALQLDENWSILFDNNQWIIAKRRNRRDEAYWHPVSYVGSTKTRLLHVAAEKGIQIDNEAAAIIKTWPERFLDWLSLFEGRAA